MTERRLTILQINDLHGYLEPHPEAFRGRGKFNGSLQQLFARGTQVRGSVVAV